MGRGGGRDDGGDGGGGGGALKVSVRNVEEVGVLGGVIGMQSRLGQTLDVKQRETWLVRNIEMAPPERCWLLQSCGWTPPGSCELCWPAAG